MAFLMACSRSPFPWSIQEENKASTSLLRGRRIFVVLFVTFSRHWRLPCPAKSRRWFPSAFSFTNPPCTCTHWPGPHYLQFQASSLLYLLPFELRLSSRRSILSMLLWFNKFLFYNSHLTNAMFPTLFLLVMKPLTDWFLFLVFLRKSFSRQFRLTLNSLCSPG